MEKQGKGTESDAGVYTILFNLMREGLVGTETLRKWGASLLRVQAREVQMSWEGSCLV